MHCTKKLNKSHQKPSIKAPRIKHHISQKKYQKTCHRTQLSHFSSQPIEHDQQPSQSPTLSSIPFDPRGGVPPAFTKPHGNPNYLTTPIYYVNGVPHLGHLYTTLVGHFFSQWKRSSGEYTLVMGGTDEHGAKVAEAAQKRGYDENNIKQFCDDVSATFSKAWTEFGLAPDTFHRTTSPEHKESVIWMWKQLARNGYIYLGKHQGWYCKSDETFVPETQLIKDQETGEFTTALGHKVEWIEEENFKFRLSAFIQPLLQYYTDHPNAIYPPVQRNNVLSMTKGLEDISISRLSKNLSWSIDVPEDTEYWDETTQTLRQSHEITQEKHKIYVWLDALNIYITGARHAATTAAALNTFEKNKLPSIINNNINATENELENGLNYPSLYQDSKWFSNHPQQQVNQHYAETYQKQLQPFWPPTSHIIGKDIAKFHCLYWPAFLMGCGLPLPRQVLVHSHWTVNGQKMSKSLGNVVSPDQLIAEFGAENTKYALLRLGNLSVDSDFDFERATALINTELADNIGNLSMRCTGVAMLPDGKYPIPFGKDFINHCMSIYQQNDVQNNNDIDNNTIIIHPRTKIPFFNMKYFQNNQQLLSPDLFTPNDLQLQEKVNNITTEFQQHMEEFRVDRALGCISELGRAANAYFAENTPWALAKQLKTHQNIIDAKDDNNSTEGLLTPEAHTSIQQRLNTVLYHSIEAVRVTSTFLHLVNPIAANLLLNQLSVPENARDISHARFGMHPTLYRAFLKYAQTTSKTPQDPSLAIDIESISESAHVSQAVFTKILTKADKEKLQQKSQPQKSQKSQKPKKSQKSQKSPASNNDGK